MTELNASIRNIPLPERMRKLPINDRGFPVPWFVAKVNGEWDFRGFDGQKVVDAYQKRLCWLCGERLGQYMAFVIGPMCAVNRISSEPPSHLECAEYAAHACPFLTNPRARRNKVELPEAAPGMGMSAGIAIEDNPGATLIWITRRYDLTSDGVGGVLFQVGAPTEVRWFKEGRRATRAEIVEVLDKRLPILRNMAKQEGTGAVYQLENQIAIAMKLIPV